MTKTKVRFLPVPIERMHRIRLDRYDATVVSIIKDTVPYHARSWVPHQREWTVKHGHARGLAAMIAAAGYPVSGIDYQ